MTSPATPTGCGARGSADAALRPVIEVDLRGRTILALQFQHNTVPKETLRALARHLTIAPPLSRGSYAVAAWNMPSPG